MTEIQTMLNSSYAECCSLLLIKYGPVTGDYFLDKSCTKKNTVITRGDEGLYIHHISEDKEIMLSSPKYAKQASFEYQKASRLVYCNLLEHLVLHIKIFEKTGPNTMYGIGGIYNFIVPELNDIYSGIKYTQTWKQKVIDIVYPLKSDYFHCIKKLVELEFGHPLLTTFIHNGNIGWDISNNKSLFEELQQIGVTK
jgi:hypothetical protein